MRQLFLSSLCADKKGQSYSLSGNKHLTSQLTPIRCGAHLVLLFTAFIILTEPLSVKQNYFCLHFWNYITQNGIDIYFLLINNHFIIPHDIQSNMPSFDRSSRLKLFSLSLFGVYTNQSLCDILRQDRQPTLIGMNPVGQILRSVCGGKPTAMKQINDRNMLVLTNLKYCLYVLL